MVERPCYLHLATIVWDNREKVVPILASVFKPLLGRALMDRLQLIANSVNFRLYGALKPKTIVYSIKRSACSSASLSHFKLFWQSLLV